MKYDQQIATKISSHWIYLLILPLIFSCVVHAQDPPRVMLPNRIILLPQGNIFESVSGFGIQNYSFVSNASIIAGNPASLTAITEKTLSVSFQHDSETGVSLPWIRNNNQSHSRYRNWLPQTVSLTVPMNNWVLNLGFNQKYNSQWKLGDIPETTIENPEGTGRVFNPIFKRNIYSFTGATAYRGVLSSDGGSTEISFGGRLCVDVFNVSEDILRANFSGKAAAIGASFGVAIENSIFRASLGYQSGVEFEGEGELDPPIVRLIDIDPFPDSSDTRNPVELDNSVEFVGEIPARLLAGLAARLTGNFWLHGDLRMDFWDSISSGDNDSKHLSYGVNWLRSEQNQFSLGMLWRDSQYSTAKSAWFYYTGLRAGFNRLVLDFLIASSYFTSDESVEQNLIKAGLGVKL